MAQKEYKSMTKEELLGLEIKELISIVNSITREGKKVSEVAKMLNISDKTLRNKAKENNYAFSRELKEYVLNDDNSVKEEEEKKSKTKRVIAKKVPQRNDKIKDESMTKSEEEKRKKSASSENEILKSIALSVDCIRELLEADREEKKNERINISLENKEELRTSIRVNKEVWEEFELFSNRNKIYKKKDLLSMALKEYIENHK
uniref:hypothetical protein n=1 Tax=Clostridium perfringens TaxID=1502 RepID=UPI0039E8AD51